MNGSLCIVFSSLGLGGIPKRIVDIVNEAEESSPNTKIFILLKKRSAFDLRSTINNRNVTILDFYGRWPMNNSFLFIFWVWAYILRLSPGTILSFISPFAIIVLITKILFFWRSTHIVINEGHYTSTMIRSMMCPSVQRFGIRILYPLADTIIVPTRAVKNGLRNFFGVSPSNIKIIGNWSKYAGVPLENMKRIYDCIYIGRFEKEKNILPVLSMLSTVIHTSNPSLSCIFIGRGTESNLYENFIHYNYLSKNIRILPPTTNVAAYLNQSKILIFNPEKNTEGFPVAILDAMACGAIVITKYFYGVNDVMNGSNGYVVRSRREMGNRIKEVLATYPSQKIVIKLAKKYVSAYNSLANIRSYTQLIYGSNS
jgi:glycosyltransferase involved in cell wall biosynthesis